MGQILVDHARARGYQKRGAGEPKVSLDGAAIVSATESTRMVALDEALKRLTEISPRKSDVVEMRFFGGLSVEETAAVLKVSRLTVIRDWTFARAWLLAEMNGEHVEEGSRGQLMGSGPNDPAEPIPRRDASMHVRAPAQRR